VATGQSLIIVSCLWQAYDHWRGQHEHDLIPKINAFCEKVRPHADVMWANDHMNEIHNLHDVQPQDLKFYDTVSIVENYDRVYVCGYHAERCCTMKGWGTQPIGIKGLRCGMIQDLTVWWNHPPDDIALTISARYSDLVSSDWVLETIC